VSESSALIAFYTAATHGWAQHRNRPMRPPLHEQFHIGSAIKHVPRETEPVRLPLNPQHLPPSDGLVPHDARRNRWGGPPVRPPRRRLPDSIAREVSEMLLARSYDQQLPLIERVFIILRRHDPGHSPVRSDTGLPRRPPGSAKELPHILDGAPDAADRQPLSDAVLRTVIHPQSSSGSYINGKPTIVSRRGQPPNARVVFRNQTVHVCVGGEDTSSQNSIHIRFQVVVPFHRPTSGKVGHNSHTISP